MKKLLFLLFSFCITAQIVVVKVKKRSYVNMLGKEKNRSPFVNTGVGFVYAKGYVIAPGYLFSTETECVILTKNGKKYKATVVARDLSTDLVLLKVDESLEPQCSLHEAEVSAGQKVILLCIPYELLDSPMSVVMNVSLHTIHSRSLPKVNNYIGRNAESMNTDLIICSTTLEVGGIVFDDSFYRIIGIVAMPYSQFDMRGLCFVIPAKVVKKVADHLIKYGRVKRPELGINFVEIDEDMISACKLELPIMQTELQKHGLKFCKGFVITKVANPEQKLKAGEQTLKIGDIMLGINKEPLQSVEQVQSIVSELMVDSFVTIIVLREKKIIALKIKVSEMKTQQSIVKNVFGIELMKFDNKIELRRRYNIQTSVTNGLIIRLNVDDLKLKSGDVICKANGKKIVDFEDFEKIASDAFANDEFLILLISRGDSMITIAVKNRSC